MDMLIIFQDFLILLEVLGKYGINPEVVFSLGFCVLVELVEVVEVQIILVLPPDLGVGEEQLVLWQQ
jgi:hypothetical protein